MEERSGEPSSIFEDEDKERVDVKDPWQIELDEEGSLGVRAPLVPLLDDRSDYIVLGRSASAHRKWRKKGLLEIGAVGEHQETGEDLFGKKVLLDAAFPHIIFICGKRGSGKSYTLGIFAEELMRSSIGVGVVMIDPIGIFWSIKGENRSKKEKKILEKWGLSPHSFPEVKVLVPEGSRGETTSSSDGVFTIGVGEMTPDDWCQVFDVDRFKTQGLLIGTAINQVENGYDSAYEGRIIHIKGKNGRYSIDDIVQCIESSLTITSKTGGFTPQTRRSIIARFNSASKWGIFDIDGTPLNEITSPNRTTVLDVSDPRLGDEKRSLITGIIARKILSARIHSARVEDRADHDPDDPDLIPVTWLLIDEAHVILPHKGQSQATEALVEYAKQGRRPGCALVLATQRPASTSDEILSQVDILLGHNLALEDDMTALRRRVPAKLPVEFANSDFIRAIPVGTAIMADQRTQQRSFLLRVRPRFSHHAGSSAMPSAFIERKKRKNAEKVSVFQAEASSEKIPGENEERFVVNNGTSVLVIDQSMEIFSELLTRVEPKKKAVLFSRMPPENYPIGASIEIVKGFWLSSTPGDMNIPPTSLQEISMEAGTFLSGSEGNVVIFDGLDFLIANNGREPVKKLLEILHEKTIVHKGILLFRGDLGSDKDILDMLSKEADRKVVTFDDLRHTDSSSGADETVIPDKREGTAEEEPEKNDPKKDDVEQKENLKEKVKVPISDAMKDDLQGSLDREDLEWMCGVLDISDKGDDKELLSRILEHEPGREGGKGDIDRLRSLVNSTKKDREENERLKVRIDDIEKKMKRKTRSKKKRSKKKDLVLEWDESEKGELPTRKEINDLIGEVGRLKKELASSPGKDHRDLEPALLRILETIKKDRVENFKRIEKMEDLLKTELEVVRKKVSKEDIQQEPVKDVRPTVKTKDKKIRALPPVGRSKTVKQPRKKVLKKGREAVIVRPKVGKKEALESSRKVLKRTFFRGIREQVENMEAVYIPLYRFLVGYKGALFKGHKEGDLYIDAVSGETVRSVRSGLERSKGMSALLKMTDLELKVFRTLSDSEKEDLKISKKAGMPLKDVRRVLTSLAKKGIVEKNAIEGNINLFKLKGDIDIPLKPWTKDSDIYPDWVEGIEEKCCRPLIDVKSAERIVEILSDDVRIIQMDRVEYPYYIATIVGEGRERKVAVNAVSGKVDTDLSPFLQDLIFEQGDT